MDDRTLQSQHRQLGSLPVQLCVRVCSRSLKLNEFLDWVPGTVLSFDQVVSDPLELRVGDQTLGKGKAVKVGPKIGLRVQRIGN